MFLCYESLVRRLGKYAWRQPHASRTMRAVGPHHIEDTGRDAVEKAHFVETRQCVATRISSSKLSNRFQPRPLFAPNNGSNSYVERPDWQGAL